MGNGNGDGMMKKGTGLDQIFVSGSFGEKQREKWSIREWSGVEGRF
jgi:hypothetical protein